jgi:hypothetical protein
MKTIIYYDINSIDSMLCTFLYKNYMNWSANGTDVFIPYDGRNQIELAVDPQTANAYDRYLFIELPPNQQSLTMLLTNRKEVVLFAYAPPNWQQNLGATIQPMGISSTIANVFSNWLLTVVDSHSFYVQLVTILGIANEWEQFNMAYLNPTMQDNLRNTFQFLNSLIKTGYSTAQQDLRHALLGSWAYQNSLADASNAYASSYHKAIQSGSGDETIAWTIFRLNVSPQNLQSIDRVLTQNYLSPYNSDPKTFVEYWELVPSDDDADAVVVSIRLKPVNYLVPPIFERNVQALTDLVGQDVIGDMVAYKEAWYDTRIGGPYPDMTQNQDGTFSLKVQPAAFFEDTELVLD